MKTIEINGKNYEIKDGSCHSCPYYKGNTNCELNLSIDSFCLNKIGFNKHPKLIISEPDSWKKGDILVKDNTNVKYQIIEFLGDIVFIQTALGGMNDLLNMIVKSELMRTCWRLEQDVIKEPIVTELTLEEVAKKFNIPVDELRIKEK